MRIKNSLLLLTLLFLCFALSGSLFSPEIPKSITDSFNKGDSKELARHFNNNIELVVLDNEDVYSKSQAELILRKFFSVHKPVGFKLLHQGGPELSRYAIGNLKTEKENFRVYFLLKGNDDALLIHLLRIERTEDN